MILLQCTELWKYLQTSAAGLFLEEGPLQLRPRIKTDKAIQDTHSHFCFVHKQNYDFHFLGHLPTNSPPSLCDISISFWSCSTTELLHALFSVSRLHPGVVSLQQWAGSPVCCTPWDTAPCWAGLVTAFGTLWGAQTWRALLYPLLHRQPSQNPAVPSKPSKTSQFAALADLICLLLFGFACLGEVCAFCRQRGGGGWGWQGRWRTWWYTEYIEQCIMYWVMQQPEN